MDDLSRSDYESLAEFRFQIRSFLRFSEDEARQAGLEPRQHQMLLAVKGLPGDLRPTIGVLAGRLQIQHHSAVELADRLSRAGYVQRKRAASNRREVLLSLTAKGEKVLRALSLAHRNELQTAGPALIGALYRVLPAPGRGQGARRLPKG